MRMNYPRSQRPAFNNVVGAQNVLGPKDGERTRSVQVAWHRALYVNERGGKSPGRSPESEPKEAPPFFRRIALENEAFKLLPVGFLDPEQAPFW
jgi:hypothetical protein